MRKAQLLVAGACALFAQHALGVSYRVWGGTCGAGYGSSGQACVIWYNNNTCSSYQTTTTFGTSNILAACQARAAADYPCSAASASVSTVSCPGYGGSSQSWQVCNIVLGSLKPRGTTCREATDLCDAPEVCDGVSSTCPADGNVAAGTPCRARVGECDETEFCTGSSKSCPADLFSPSGRMCRPLTGDAIIQPECGQLCTGSSPYCLPKTAGTVCRLAVGPCDVAESCNGSALTCPGDAVVPAGQVCRPAAGPCDVAESCNGDSSLCPTDVFHSASTPCRLSVGDCDVPEYCTGSAATCPADRLATAGATCRPVAGACDVAEVCTGSSGSCPADSYAAAGTTCRASTGPCDAPFCTGASPSCPAVAYLSQETVCRPSAFPCDAPELCSGASVTCPADTVFAVGTSCSSQYPCRCDSQAACRSTENGGYFTYDAAGNLTSVVGAQAGQTCPGASR